MANVILRGDDERLYLVPEGTPETDIKKGVPLSADLSFLNFPVQWECRLSQLLDERKLRTPADFDRPGAYAEVADCLRVLVKQTANEIVDTIRSQQS